MELIKKCVKMKAWSARQRGRGARIGFVPTMGFLHGGHLSLVRYARGECDRLVVSIFVNPMQFGPQEDLADYPMDLDRDLALLEPMGVDAVFLPAADDLYPPHFQTRVSVAEVTRGLCGAFRPDFFTGVTTVVLKLFNIIRPDLAVFGEKDYQQLLAVRRMAADLNLDVEVHGRPTVREPDGLAMSSRNSYLSPAERADAAVLSRSLQLAEGMAAQGRCSASEILAEVRRHIGSVSSAELQYAALVDPQTLEDVREIQDKALLALAIFIGRTRLIDNAVIRAGPGEGIE